jgi:hypothetical protein
MSYAKGDLTCDEKLRAAYAYLINGIPQHHIAALYAVNPGRISEAVTATAKALGFPDKRLRHSMPKDTADEYGMPSTPIKNWDDDNDFR